MMRPKKRYIVVRLEGTSATGDEARRAIDGAVATTWGDEGLGRAAVKLIAFDGARQEAVVRCALSSLERVIAALALCTSIHGRPAALRVARVTGILARVKPASRSTQRI